MVASWHQQHSPQAIVDIYNRTDILLLISNYNSQHPLEKPVSLIPIQEDSDIISKLDLKNLTHDKLREANERLDEMAEKVRALVDASQPQATPVSPVTGDHVPPWLGEPGFEEQTAAYFEKLEAAPACETLTTLVCTEEPPPRLKTGLEKYNAEMSRGMGTKYGFGRRNDFRRSAEDEERADEQLAALKGKVIGESRAEVLRILRWYVGRSMDGSLQLSEDEVFWVENILAQAKGKCHENDRMLKIKNTSFTSLVDFQKEQFVSMNDRREGHMPGEDTTMDVLLSYWWSAYSMYCLATETDVNPEVVAVAKNLLVVDKKTKK